jgi:hypothetical protein
MALWPKNLLPKDKEKEAFRNLRKGMEEYFEDFEVELPEKFDEQGEIHSSGWSIHYVIHRDESGAPVMDFSADHRMTNLAHVRILPSGEMVTVGMIMDHYSYDPDDEEGQAKAQQQLEEHNERVYQGLREKGLA